MLSAGACCMSAAMIDVLNCCVQPCRLRDWELHVHFKIHGDAPELYGDGFAVWYTKHRMELGSVSHFVFANFSLPWFCQRCIYCGVVWYFSN